MKIKSIQTRIFVMAVSAALIAPFAYAQTAFNAAASQNQMSSRTAAAPGIIASSTPISLSTEETAAQIRQTTLEQREVMLTSLQARINAIHAAVRQLQTAVARLNEKDRADFKTAMNEVRIKETALESNVDGRRQNRFLKLARGPRRARLQL